MVLSMGNLRKIHIFIDMGSFLIYEKMTKFAEMRRDLYAASAWLGNGGRGRAVLFPSGRPVTDVRRISAVPKERRVGSPYFSAGVPEQKI